MSVISGHKIILITIIKGELQRENKLISYERVFKMLENDMYIAGIGQAVLELLSFKLGQEITKSKQLHPAALKK